MTSHQPPPQPPPRPQRLFASSPSPRSSPDPYDGALYSSATPTVDQSSAPTMSSPAFRYFNPADSFSPTMSGEELYPSYLDVQYSASGSPTVVSGSQYAYSAPPSQQLPFSSPSQSAAAFSSLAMSVPLLPALRSPTFRPSPPMQSAATSQQPQPQPPQPLMPHPSRDGGGHSVAAVPKESLDDPNYALSIIASMARKSERAGAVRPLRPAGFSLPERFRPDDRSSPDSYTTSSLHPERFMQHPPAQQQPQQHYAMPVPVYEQLPAPFQPPGSLDSPSASSSSSPLPPYPAPPSRLDSPIMYRKSSCLLCHRAKTSCDGRRPCDRCIRLDRADQCVERTKADSRRKPPAGKKRKVEDGEDEPKEDDAHDDAAPDKDDAMDDDATVTSPPAPHTALVPPALPSPPATGRSVLQSSGPSVSHHIVVESDGASLVGVDDRELSGLMLRILKSDDLSIRSLLRTASQRKLIPPMAFQALISYLANALHPDDYASFMTWIDADQRRLEGEVGEAASTAASRLQVRLPDGTLMPRVRFTFRKSSLTALSDSEIAVNTAQILIWRVKPGTSGGTLNDKGAIVPPQDSPDSSTNKHNKDAQTSPTATRTAATTDAVRPRSLRRQAVPLSPPCRTRRLLGGPVGVR